MQVNLLSVCLVVVEDALDLLQLLLSRGSLLLLDRLKVIQTTDDGLDRKHVPLEEPVDDALHHLKEDQSLL